MQAVTTIGLDIAKSVFQVHGIDVEGNVIIRRQLKRRYVLAFFEKLPPCLGITTVRGANVPEHAYKAARGRSVRWSNEIPKKRKARPECQASPSTFTLPFPRKNVFARSHRPMKAGSMAKLGRRPPPKTIVLRRC
jgi:hypothetical protein